MYKVFVNESLLIFSDSQVQQHGEKTLMALPEDTERIIRNLLSGVFSATDYFIPMSDLETEAYLNKHFETVTAAGGIVMNAKDEILWIYRRNKWDLPKGKADKGETPEQTALREVQEECGISQLSIERFLGKAYHIYPISKGKRAVFKTTWFYLMRTAVEHFTPQAEEEITEIRFFAPEDETPYQNTFRSLKSFMNEHEEQKK